MYRTELRRRQENGEDSLTDVWNGEVMQSERMKRLFEDSSDNERAIALQFSLDGVQTHKLGLNEVWPLICLNLNLPLFKDNISNDVFKMWNQLAMGVTIATKTEVNTSDIANVETAYATSLHAYYRKVYQCKRDRLAACTYTVHALSHVTQCMRWWGPLSNIWQFASERFCGLVVSRCRSRVSAAANVHEMLKLRVALQAVACTTNSGISLQNKSQSGDHRHASLSHPD